MRPQTILVSFLALAAPTVLGLPLWAKRHHNHHSATKTAVDCTSSTVASANVTTTTAAAASATTTKAATKTKTVTTTTTVAATSATASATAVSDATATTDAVGSFVPSTDYSSFQISGGVAGKAQAEAEAVFVTPFDGVDLSTVDQATITALNIMRELAEDAETDLFNPQITAASGADATALQVGKIKNKVLKLTGEVQVLKIKIAVGKAAGKDTSSEESDLTVEQGKLTKNIATDVKSAGQASKAATGTVTPRSS